MIDSEIILSNENRLDRIGLAMIGPLRGYTEGNIGAVSPLGNGGRVNKPIGAGSR